jgi:uncharacterized FlaG/YvyC family protein
MRKSGQAFVPALKRAASRSLGGAPVNTNSIHNQEAPAVPLDSQNPQLVAQQRRLRQAVHAINKAEAYGPRSELNLSVDQATRLPLLQVVDKETKQVLLQIPTESVLRMAHDLPKS